MEQAIAMEYPIVELCFERLILRIGGGITYIFSVKYAITLGLERHFCRGRQLHKWKFFNIIEINWGKRTNTNEKDAFKTTINNL